MLGRIDGLRVGDRAMVHPDDDVAPVVAVAGDRDRLALRVQRDERARCVEPDPDDFRGVDGRDRVANRGTNRVPNVVRRLLDVIRLGMPGFDRVFAAPRGPPVSREAARARTPGPDVDADHIAHAYPLLAHVHGSTPGSAPIRSLRPASPRAGPLGPRRSHARERTRTRNPSRRDSSAMSANTSPYATAT